MIAKKENGHSVPMGAAETTSRVRPRRKRPNQYVAETWAMANMNIHDMEGQIEVGDTFKTPKFRDKRGKLRSFDRAVAPAQRRSAILYAKPHRRASQREDNPMWNQDWFTEADDDADELDRFSSRAGFPGKLSADCGWVQYMHASLKADGRAAVVLDTGAASRGSGNAGTNKEKTVRQWFVDQDLVESVLYLPEPSGASRNARKGSPQGERGCANQNLSYHTTDRRLAIMHLSRSLPQKRLGQNIEPAFFV